MKRPTLLGAYGAIERRIEPRIAALLQDPQFHQALGVVTGTQSALGGVVEGARRRVLHALNLPTGTDILRLRRQVGELDHEIRALRLEIEKGLEGRDDGR